MKRILGLESNLDKTDKLLEDRNRQRQAVLTQVLNSVSRTIVEQSDTENKLLRLSSTEYPEQFITLQIVRSLRDKIPELLSAIDPHIQSEPADYTTGILTNRFDAEFTRMFALVLAPYTQYPLHTRSWLVLLCRELCNRIIDEYKKETIRSEIRKPLPFSRLFSRCNGHTNWFAYTLQVPADSLQTTYSLTNLKHVKHAIPPSPNPDSKNFKHHSRWENLRKEAMLSALVNGDISTTNTLNRIATALEQFLKKTPHKSTHIPELHPNDHTIIAQMVTDLIPELLDIVTNHTYVGENSFLHLGFDQIIRDRTADLEAYFRTLSIERQLGACILYHDFFIRLRHAYELASRKLINTNPDLTQRTITLSFNHQRPLSSILYIDASPDNPTAYANYLSQLLGISSGETRMFIRGLFTP